MGSVKIMNNVFMALARDTELIELLEVGSDSIADIRKHIIDEHLPGDLADDRRIRICVYELPTTISKENHLFERGWIEIDIYVPKSVQKRDRRERLIADRLMKILHNTRLAGVGMHYYTRLGDLSMEPSDWACYGIVFSYDRVY